MYIRSKLSIFLSLFFLIVMFFSAGSIYIFGKIHDNIELMRQVSEEHRLNEELKRSVSKFVQVAKDWAFTGRYRYKREYREKREVVFKAFGALDRDVKDKEQLRKIGILFDEIDDTVKDILKRENPVGDKNVLLMVRELEDRELNIMSNIVELEEMTLRDVRKVTEKTRAIKESMSFYLVMLIILSALATLSLLIILKKSISDPVDSIMAATEKVSQGDLSYRLVADRHDEFGLLARRFNEMIEQVETSDRRLKEKLHETELLLDIARIAGTASDLGTAFNVIADIIAERTGRNGCAIYTLRHDDRGFKKEAASAGVADTFSNLIPPDDVLAMEAFAHLRPLFVRNEDLNTRVLSKRISGNLLMVPIVSDSRIFGMIIVISRSDEEFLQDEINLFVIIAHTIGTAIKNAELYSETKTQLKRFTALYELARSITGTIDLEELFAMVSGEMTRLLNARGCIIRLVEDGTLPVKASYGLSLKTEKEMNLHIGDGIAGWVAQKGKPLLVEDVASMPEEMRVPVLRVKSVVCVPMKIGDRIIGTIGLYDKKNDNGNIISFSFDDLATAEGFASITAVAIEKIFNFDRQRQKEKESLEAKKRMEILFDSVRGAILTIDREGNILLANRYVETWTGMKAEEITGKNSIEIFHGSNNPICPHCAAKATFETGEINSITQSRGINYAELTAYPIKDEHDNVVEAVVFIQDITDRVLYQEEILSLYKEVSQTKEYLESLIDNSADAIITTDLNGIVTSWNKGAERIYGYTEEEAINTFLPFLPEFLIDTEREYMERLKNGETIKDIETVRVRKDGTMFEVSLTLSPIKDSSGDVIGISGISRDISEKKKVEKELIRRNQELSRLFFISSAMRGTLELERLLRMVLTAVTMSDGLGFNRAMLFMLDEERGTIRGVMGVGPADAEEAWRIWDRLSVERKTLPELIKEVEKGPLNKDSFLDKLSLGIEVSLDEDTALTRAVKEKIAINVTDVHKDPLTDPVLIQQTGTQAYALIPLISRDRVLGVLWVDNFFNRKPITDDDIRFLTVFSDQVAAAIESARLFEQVKLAEAELENIFESISDMVYFNTKDYTIKNVNRAVAERIGKPVEEIIGQKCYRVFHGMDEPWEKCPHHKTVKTKKPFVEELDDPHLGGTFLVSSSPIFNPHNELLGTVHVVRDISELKKLREKVATSERMAALGEVAAKVAHEIRNPLVSIGGFSRRLEKKLDGSLKDYASVITNEVTRLEGILKEILSYVREVRLVKDVTSPNAVVEEVLPLFQEEVRKKKIKMVMSLDRDVSPVEVDINKIKEALINIIGNAVDAVSEGGEIRISTFNEKGYAVTEIADNGHGVDPRDMPYLFDPFYTTKVSGTGLGLSITHRIIEQHRGKIEMESEKGKGATFRIYLPVKEEES